MNTQNRLKLDFKQCRICLQNQSECKNEIIAPCKCSGSIKHVHRSCMEKWIETSVKKKTKKLTPRDLFIECEMCKQPIYYELHKAIKFNNCSQFTKSIKQNKYLNLTLFLILLFVLLSLGLIIWFIAGSKITFQDETMYQSILLIVLSAMILIFCLISPLAIFCLYFFHFEYKCALKNILAKQQPSVNQTPDPNQ